MSRPTASLDHFPPDHPTRLAALEHEHESPSIRNPQFAIRNPVASRLC